MDPCQDYLALASAEPVSRNDDLGVWIVTGFAEVTRLLGHPALSSAWPEQGRTQLHDGDTEGARTADPVRRWFMFADEPRHRALRNIIGPLFTARRVAEFQPYVEAVVGELLDGVTDRLDVVTDLAVPLSSRVICRLLGLPPQTAPRLPGWALDIAALLVADYLPDVVRRGTTALAEITAVVRAALAGAGPADGTALAVLRRAQTAGQIDELDVAATASLLVFAGFETTATFLCKAVRTLLHTGQWAALTPAAVPAAVEELLRFDTSVQQVARLTVAPVEVAGHRIPKGELVLLMLGVANRDPEAFARPNLLDLSRPPARHLGFGHSAHYCLGAGLARLEVGTALRQLKVRWGEVELAAAPVLRPHHGVTSFEHLELRLHAGVASGTGAARRTNGSEST